MFKDTKDGQTNYCEECEYEAITGELSNNLHTCGLTSHPAVTHRSALAPHQDGGEVQGWEKDMRTAFDSWYKSQIEMNPYIMRDWFIARMNSLLKEQVEKIVLKGERRRVIEQIRGEVESMRKECVPADSVWIGDDDFKEGEHKLVPKVDGMYCLTCERFMPEEGCLCGWVKVDDILSTLDTKSEEPTEEPPMFKGTREALDKLTIRK